jgi:hypothetical protein
MPKKETAEMAVRDIRRKTRRRFPAEEKITDRDRGAAGRGSPPPYRASIAAAS